MRLDESFDGVLTAARGGAPWAFERLWADLSPAVAGYMRMQGVADHEDLTSDVFMRVFTHLTDFQGGEENFRTWIFTVAHHRLVDERRRIARRPNLVDLTCEEAGPLCGGDAETDVFTQLGNERIRQLCALLAADQRDVLLMRIVADMTLEQTAAAMGRSTGAVKALQHRAIAALRQKLSPERVST